MMFADLPRNHFGAILADPPWHWSSWGKFRKQRKGLANTASRDVQNHYGVMETDDISSLPVSRICAADCVLFLWATNPMLPEAFRVISEWGFQYKTISFTWAKTTPTSGEWAPKWHVGLGYWTRANTESCLLATKGKPKRIAKDVRQLIVDRRREHSRKPDGIHERIERLVAGPYLELFARQKRPGWTVWGNETDKFKSLEAAE